MNLTVTAPAAPSDAFAFAGGRPAMRKYLSWYARHGKTLLVKWKGEPAIFVAMMRPGWRRIEVCPAFNRMAAPAMVPLLRLAHLTFSRMHQDGYRIEIAIRHPDAMAIRLAQLAGFSPDRGERWIWTGGNP